MVAVMTLAVRVPDALTLILLGQYRVQSLL
jgi:hypothetical protein